MGVGGGEASVGLEHLKIYHKTGRQRRCVQQEQRLLMEVFCP